MSEMVERAARNIYERRNGHGCRAWGSLPKSHREPYLGDARVAIEAMREAGAAMVERAVEQTEDLWMDSAKERHVAFPLIFAAMIDAALHETAEK